MEEAFRWAETTKSQRRSGTVYQRVLDPVFGKVIGWSLALLLVLCVLVYLQSTAVLSWMVP